MKANEVPEKIYLQKYNEDTLICLNEWNISEEWSNKPRNEKISTNIEYTRTDAFIEKAVRFLKEWDAYRVCLEGHKDWFIEQFKKYMES